MSSIREFSFCIDRGGTFTDVYAQVPKKSASDPGYRVLKLLSEDPSYPDAPREAIRRILETETGIPHDRNVPIDTSRILSIRMGTTVATNALLERKGERIAFLVTKGFKHLLQIGNQSRPKIFDIEINRPSLLYEEVIEIDERVAVRPEVILNTSKSMDDSEKEKEKSLLEKLEKLRAIELKALANIKENDNTQLNHKIGLTGEKVYILKSPSVQEIREQLQNVYNNGIRSLAVCLAHSYTFSDHELLIEKIAKEIGFTHISLSSQLMAMVKLVSRGYTAAVDAYLTPCITRYLAHFTAGFDSNLLTKVQLAFMQSDGGLANISQFNGYRAVLSGPAGGFVGYARTNKITRVDKDSGKEEIVPVIGFDMGGTSTDVSRYDGSHFDHVFENFIAGVTVMAPQVDINTVAAGGGSQLFFRSGMFVVGPESAGANPGPACYRRDGPLTITDANLILGRIIPEEFPHIFGVNRDMPLDTEAPRRLFTALTDEINKFLSSSKGAHSHNQQLHHHNPSSKMTVEEVALGFIAVANEAMCRPIRSLTQAKGHDITRHALGCFGGAGGQHATAIARNLGIRNIYIHKFAGILSAYGMALADVVCEVQEPCTKLLNEENQAFVNQRIQFLTEKAINDLMSQGFAKNDISTQTFLNLRYHGTDTALMILHKQDGSTASYLSSFVEQYQREFGFTLERSVIIDDIRVRGVGQSKAINSENIKLSERKPVPSKVTETYFEGMGWVPTKVFLLSNLGANDEIHGPAIIIDKTSTILLEPNTFASILLNGDIQITVGESSPSVVTTALDAVQLSIFSHRFMSIAEQMGRTLQRTAISTNIKERLDFSCALFGPDGGLVANAPHLPVHLGAMQEAVRFQIEYFKKSTNSQWKDGDVVVSNHPNAGGSHLPDITVITPVFNQGQIVFFVASRGHHSDIGGISPGSMPPFSKTLAQEGAAIISFKLVENGRFNESGISELLTFVNGEPGSCGTRNLSDNISDLKAQVAANQKGITLVADLIAQYGVEVVQAYMRHIQSTAELAVREMLIDLSLEQNLKEVDTLHALDHMDDGTPIKLAVTINRAKGEATFDFTGTGPEVYGNHNAPRAITYSAIIYCLRCLVSRDIPLNQGCLAPISVIIPSGSLLSPSATAAVVGGNVLTSQRITDVVFKAFEACAASQGCMNNLTFGDETFGYYETIAGGAGAGETWNGQSGVHTHMTNTRITDVEILERRYPVLVKTFSLRDGSGGKGKFKGGDGVIREIEFLRPLTVGILSERRAFSPYGLKGGENGSCGINLLIKSNGSIIGLGGKNSYDAQPNDRIRIMTPGGGGFGSFSESNDLIRNESETLSTVRVPAGNGTVVSSLEKGGSLANFKATQESV